MLSIGSTESLALFEQLMQRRRSAPVTALEDGVHPRAVGLLLRLEASANAFEHARVVTSAARRAASALMRRVCAPSEIARACQGIRDDIEGIAMDPESLGVALRISTELGDTEDRDLVRLWCPRITSPGARLELEAMLERRDG